MAVTNCCHNETTLFIITSHAERNNAALNTWFSLMEEKEISEQFALEYSHRYNVSAIKVYEFNEIHRNLCRVSDCLHPSNKRMALFVFHYKILGNVVKPTILHHI